MIIEWRPDRLLCKRFDVPNPYYSKDQSEDDKRNALLEKEALNEKTMESLKQERNRMLAANQIIETQYEEDSMEIEDDNQNFQTIEKPSMDIFKAIFADSDSESDFTNMETSHQEKRTSVHLNVEEKPETNQSLLFRPVFRKKEERKGKKISKKNLKPSTARPSSSGVKLVFDFEEEANQVSQTKKRNTNNVRREGNKVKNRSSSEDEWVEAPQKPMNRPKASDLI
jgi:G patch domain-containing protein 1